MVLVDLGDMMIMDVKVVESPLRLVLLDVGITTSLEDTDWVNLKKVFTAIVLGQVVVMAICTL